jgi:hypothetical protein
VLLEDAPLTLRQMLWFQHGGALAFCGENSNREWLRHVRQGGSEVEGRWHGLLGRRV